MEEEEVIDLTPLSTMTVVNAYAQLMIRAGKGLPMTETLEAERLVLRGEITRRREALREKAERTGVWW